MKSLLFFLLIPFIVYSNDFHSEDFEFVTDSSQKEEDFELVVESPQKEEDFELVTDSSQKEASNDTSPKVRILNLANTSKITPYFEGSFGNIWFTRSYDQYWGNEKNSLFMEGFGVSVGCLFQSFTNLQIEVGLRLHKSGYKENIFREYYQHNYDTVTGQLIDSMFIAYDGYYTANLYYLSMPVSTCIILKGLPVYLIGGIELGYLLQATLVEKSDANNQNAREYLQDVKRFYRPLDVNLNVGAGRIIKLNNHLDLHIKLVYSPGLIVITDNWAGGAKYLSREISVRGLFTFR